MSSELILTDNVASPSAPSAGKVSLYAKTDGNLYSKTPANVETLVTAGSGITNLTGDVAASGPGSATATIQTNVVSNSKLAQAPRYTIKGNNTGSTANEQDLDNNIILGTPEYTDLGIALQMTGNSLTYFQSLLQNANSSTNSSTDFIVSNDLGTLGSFYGDFGINSSNFTGTGSLGLPNAVYLYSQDTDLVIGTGTANKLHFVTNSSTTDAMQIDASGNLSIPSATGYFFAHGTSAVTYSSTIPTASLSGTVSLTTQVSGVLPIANGGTSSSTATGTGSVVLATSPTLVTPALGIPTAITLTNATGLPLTTGVTGVLPVANGGTNSNAALSNNRVMQSSGGAIVEASAITASRALVSDANGIPVASVTTTTELSYVSGVTSAIQTQLNTKSNSFAIVSVTSDVTLTTNAIHLVSSAAARNLTLPAHVAGQRLYIKDSTGSAGTNNFTIIRTGGGNIDGIAASRILSTNWGSWQFIDDGTDWYLL